MIKNIFKLFLLWRILLFIPLILGHFLIPIRPGYHYTFFSYYIPQNISISNYLLSSWANFDGAYYLLIAASGYSVNAGFFPLLPITIHAVSSVFLGHVVEITPALYVISLVLTSTYFFLALFVLFKLIKIDFSEKIAWKTIIYLLLFPVSFFFVSIYTEGLFLLLSVLCLYFARSNKWFLSCVCGALLSATRLVGLAIIPALIIELILQKKLAQKGWMLLLTTLGILGYAWYCYVKWHDALFFIHAQGLLKNNRSVTSFIFPLQTVYRYIKILATVNASNFEFWIALLEISTFLFAVWLFCVAWKRKVRLSYIVFALFAFLLPVSSGTFTGLPRYVAVLFPLFIALSLVESKRVKILYSLISGILLILLFALFSRGYYIA